MARCRSCGAEIVWVESASSGRPMPLDAQPVKGGNISVQVMPGETKKTAKVLWKDPDRVAHVSHFATCPQASKWRKPD